MLYEILTENKKRKSIENITSKYFEGFNTQLINGYWQNIKESSLKISIIADNSKKTNNNIKLIAQKIKDLNNQDAVLINKINNEYQLI